MWEIIKLNVPLDFGRKYSMLDKFHCCISVTFKHFCIMRRYEE